MLPSTHLHHHKQIKYFFTIPGRFPRPHSQPNHHAYISSAPCGPSSFFPSFHHNGSHAHTNPLSIHQQQHEPNQSLPPQAHAQSSHPVPAPYGSLVPPLLKYSESRSSVSTLSTTSLNLEGGASACDTSPLRSRSCQRFPHPTVTLGEVNIKQEPRDMTYDSGSCCGKCALFLRWHCKLFAALHYQWPPLTTAVDFLSL